MRRVISRAFLAASRALDASSILPTIIFASAGFSNKYSPSFSFTEDSTGARTSDETSLSLVCDENLGSGTLIDKMAVSPSLVSSPVMAAFSFFAKPELSIKLFRVRVRAALSPAKCAPPSL